MQLHTKRPQHAGEITLYRWFWLCVHWQGGRSTHRKPRKDHKVPQLHGFSITSSSWGRDGYRLRMPPLMFALPPGVWFDVSLSCGSSWIHRELWAREAFYYTSLARHLN